METGPKLRMLSPKHFLAFSLGALLPLVYAQDFPDPRCPRNPKPPDFFFHHAVCDRHGQLDLPPVLSQTANNFDQCRNLCLRRQRDTAQYGDYDLLGCARFLWHPDSKICEFYDLEAKFAPNASSQATFFDSRCYKCPECHPQVGSNLLDDEGFEAGKTLIGPWTTETNGTVNITHLGFDSPSALHIAAVPNGSTGTSLSVSQTFASCVGTAYLATLVFKPLFNQGAIPSIWILGGDTLIQVPARAIRNNTWTQFRFYFNPLQVQEEPADLPRITDQIKMIVSNSSSTSSGSPFAVYLDNAKVSAINPVTIPASSPQLVRNGGFESGQLRVWIAFPADEVRVKQPGIRSKYAFVAKTYAVSSTFRLSQPVQGLVVGAEYVLSFDFIGVFQTRFTISFGATTFRANECLQNNCRGDLQWVFIAREPKAVLEIYAFYGFVDIPANIQVTVDNVSLRKL